MTGGSGWTSKAVKDTLVEAVRWVRYSGGPVGPAAIRSCMPHYAATLDDHLEEGWGLPESADDELEVTEMRISPTPERVDELVDALTWISRFVTATNPGSARMLSLWLRCRVERHNFVEALGGKVSRGHAYRMRDRALSLIAIALTVRDEANRDR